MKMMIALLVLASVGHCYGPHHPKGPYQHYKPDQNKGGGVKLLENKEMLNDRTHIEEDLENLIGNVHMEQITNGEISFYYFDLHDSDNNTKLDGLEILQAIKHTLHDHGDSNIMDSQPLSPEELQFYVGKFIFVYIFDDSNSQCEDLLLCYTIPDELIDTALQEDDLDQDGYLSYFEYSLGKGKAERDEF